MGQRQLWHPSLTSLHPSSGSTAVPLCKAPPWKRTIATRPRILQQGKMEGKLPTNTYGKLRKVDDRPKEVTDIPK